MTANLTLAVRVDWFRVINDLCGPDGSLYQLAQETKIPRSTLQAYKNGREPSHSIGMYLLAVWEKKAGGEGATAPLTTRYDRIVVR
ncbi:hypothetical protein FP568_15715 [Pandoraea pnomenusa]|uniref:hypothetical protein n=1 Tax=Pandoraea pnomenusa TaxID=93220 RepID=UPI001198B9AA|nr:hypothetical protein [Pandoraea pnomenusa]QDX22558.1 hypothetical protein FP568_15715 [Pandoraea pnomenusa]